MSCDIKSKKKEVQFDVVNNTSSPISLNLFDSNTLTQTPTPENITFFPANSEINSIDTSPFAPATTRFNAVSQVSGNVYITDNLNPRVLVFDADGVFITSINTLGTNTNCIIYNDLTDEVYVTGYLNNRIMIIDCATNTLTNSYTLVGASDIGYPSIDTLRQRLILPRPASSSITIFVLSTTTQIGVGGFGGSSPRLAEYDADLDLYWIISTTPDALYSYNPITTVQTLQPAVPPPSSFGLTKLSGTNKLYLSGGNVNSYSIIDTTTGNYIFTQPAVANSINLAIDETNGLIYVAKFLNDVYVYDLNNVLVTIINSGQNVGQGITFSAFNNRMYLTSIITNRTYIYTTVEVPSTNYYIGGSSDYNFFLQSILDEPIKLDCLNIISNNQDQLNNPITISKNDADGHSNQYPEFPLLDVSAWQQQGNRSSIPMGGIILDGRTFFSQYVINPNETVVFELCYEQLNRFCFAQHPELFSSLKPIAKEEKEKIESTIIERDKKESGENESKFEIIKDSLAIDISVTNNTGNISTFNFFEANQNQLIINTPSVTFADVDAYNFLVQQLRESPLVLNAVEVISSDQNQLTLPVSVTTDDANGDSITYQHFPINKVSAYQEQGNRIIVKTNHLILDGYTTFASYNILPHTTISFVLYYKQFKRNMFLDKHFFRQLKKSIFPNNNQFGNGIEYINDVSQEATNKNSLKNNSKNKEKNINFGTEQVYSVGFDGKLTANPFISITKNKVVDNQEPINQKYNYRDVKKNNHDDNSYKRNIY